MATDFVWFPAMPGTVERRSYTGREGIEAYGTEIGEIWQEYRLSPDEFRDLRDRVVMLGWVTARGMGSPDQVVAPIGWAVEFRGEEVARLRGYLDHDEVLRAAGISE